MLYVGSDDGYLYVLNPGNGAEKFNFSVGAPIVGLASAVGVTVFEDSAGTIGAQKTFVEGNAGWRFPTGGGLWTVPVIVDTAVFVAAGMVPSMPSRRSGKPPCEKGYDELHPFPLGGGWNPTPGEPRTFGPLRELGGRDGPGYFQMIRSTSRTSIATWTIVSFETRGTAPASHGG